MNFQNIDLKNIDNYLTETNDKNWFITSILYASYNCILLIPALIAIKDEILKKESIKYISFIVTIITMMLIMIIYMLLMNVDVNINELEMPAVYAVNRISSGLSSAYGIIIMISIFTTAISLGISLLNNISKSKKNNKIAIYFICISSVIFSNFGFSNLVNLLYPILGVLGLLQIIVILKS